MSGVVRTWGPVLGILLLAVLHTSPVSAEVLEDVEAGTRTDGSVGVRINFNEPVQAINYTPKQRARTLYISVQIANRETGQRPRTERVTSFGNINGRLPLKSVSLELNGAEGDRLILVFIRTTPFKVFQGKDARSVLIVIPKEGLLKPPPATKPDLSERPFAGPTTGKMARARQFLIQGKNKQAIKLFSQLLRSPNANERRDARELLGLSYERDRQYTKARNQYRLYLKEYPKTTGADRVRQRLRNLTRAARRAPLRKGGRARKRTDIMYYGTISQRLFSSISNSSTGSSFDQSTLISNINLNARKRTDLADYKAVLNADYVYDLVNPVSTGKLQTAYVDAKGAWRKISGRFGRQSGRGGGVLGRFDGALVGINVFPKWRINAVGGIPVEYSTLASNKEFTGYSIDAGTFAGKWSGSLFQVNATADSFIDRQAIGGELRYFDKTTTAFGMTDYDTYFNEMNVAMVQAFWKAKDNWSYNVLVDFRKAPFLQSSNALLAPVNGTSYDTIAALVAGEPGLDLRQLAKDRTATSTVVSLGATLPNLKQFGVKSKILQKIQLGGDLSFSKSSGLPASAGQPASPGSETATMTGRAIATQLFRRNEISVAGVSLINNTDYRAIAGYVTERNRFKQNWRLDAGLKLYRQENSNGTSLTRLTPSVRLEYRRKKATFELELGRETSQSVNPLQDENIDRDFVTIGYRYDF